jgi:putative ABC transport system substrate-binding protein
MNRRAFVTGLGAVLAAPRAAGAQRKTNVRIGFIPAISEPNINTETFREVLRDIGYIDGQNATIESRWGYRFAEDAAELVRLKVDVIVAAGSPAVLAVTKATQTIPIVALDLESDPVVSGFAMSLARPGGNLTGIFLDFPELTGKLLQLTRSVASGPFAVLWDAAMNPVPLRAIEAAARSLSVPLSSVPVRRLDELTRIFDDATAARAHALIVLVSPMLFVHRGEIAAIAASRRLPMISGFREVTEAGGLMSYGPNVRDVFRRAPLFVDKILKGTKPGDMPVERPTHFAMVINLKTAKALGLTIPPSLLLRADQVIE